MDRCEEQISSSSFDGVQTCKVEEGASDLQNYETPSLEDFKFKQEEEEIIDCQISNKQLKEEEEIIDYQIPNKRLKLSENNQEDPLKLEETPTDVLEPFCAVFVEDHQEDSMSPELDEDDKSKITELQSESNSSLSQNAELIDHKGLCIVPVGVGVGLNTVTGGWSSIPQNDSGNDTVEPQTTEMIVQENITYFGRKVFHIDDGYYYKLVKGHANSIYMKCAYSAKCTGRASMPMDPSKRVKTALKVTRPHSHPPNKDWLTVMNVRLRIINRSGTEETSCKQIIKEELARLSPEVVSSPLLQKLDRIMMRRRQSLKNGMSAPSDLLQFGELLEASERFGQSMLGKPFYRATVVDEDNNSAVIFMSEPLLEVQLKFGHVQVDAKFKVVPASPECHRLIVMAPVFGNIILPTMFVLMGKTTESLYKLVFAFVKQTFSEWQPEVFTTDYDRLLQNALRHTWPAAAVVGTWCHSAKCMTTKAHSLGLTEFLWTNKNANRVFKMCQSLPFLPPEKIQEGYEYIVDFADRTDTLHKLVVFLSYVYRVWIKGVGVESFSVYRQKKRTFCLEFFHRKLRDLIRCNGFKEVPPPIWTFTDLIRRMENDIVLTTKVVENKIVISKNLRRDDKPMISKGIVLSYQVQNSIVAGELLLSVSHELEENHNRVFNLHENNSSDDEHLEGLECSRLPEDVQPQRRRKKTKKKKPEFAVN